MFSFEAEQAGTLMEIHQRAVKASIKKKTLELIKEYRPSWPGIHTFSSTKSCPLRGQTFAVGQHRVFGSVAQEHLTDDGFTEPNTAILIQINTIEPTGVTLKDLQ